MSLGYSPILWNKQKKIYDKFIVLFIVTYLVIFTFLNLLFKANISLETLIIRAFGSLAITLLHIILSIGPLSRLNKKFLVLLYNRRHLGVTMFLVAAVHGIFSIIQFHSLGNVNPVMSLFTSNLAYDSFIDFPFQTLGFFALLIFLLMAVTSHDFWLNILSPRVWKILHMLVYLAYFLVILHVMLGTFEQETSPFLWVSMLIGLIFIGTLHIASAMKEIKIDSKKNQRNRENYILVGGPEEIAENSAKIISTGGERIAVFKYEGKLSAISNVCQHQNGPLGEGKIIDGCITCPWHGYQYFPHNGCSPPPFNEKVSTYQLKIIKNKIYVNPNPKPKGTHVDPLIL